MGEFDATLAATRTVLPAQGMPGARNTVNAPENLKYPRGFQPQSDGSVVVCDTWSHRILRFPSAAEGGACAAPEVLAGVPNSCGVDPVDGSVIVADRGNARVLRFPPDSRAGCGGELLIGPDVLERPWGVCIGPDSAIYVSDERAARVLKLGGEIPAASAAEDMGLD